MDNCFVLDERSHEIQYLCNKDERLAKVIEMVGPITIDICDPADSFSFLIHEIIEQMLSVRVGAIIYERLELLCGGRVSPERIALLTDDQIKSIGTSSSKVRYIRALTDNVLCGTIDLESLSFLSDDEALKLLMSIKGIGSWTAKMFLLFVLNRPDILPYEDVAFLQAFQWLYNVKDRDPETVKKKCKKWSPYSSIAARYMYIALDTGLTKEKFQLKTQA